MLVKHITKLLIVLCSVHSFSQEIESVDTILQKAQNVLEQQATMSSEIQYCFYPTYEHKTPIESYQGKIIKNGSTQYTKINETIFLTRVSDNKLLKLNKEQKLIFFGEDTNAESQPTAGLLQTFVKLFKTKQVQDKGDYWLCTLTSDVITRLPYGTVEIYVDKKDYTVYKQVLYFLGQYPYKNNKGYSVMGNPKLEIVISNYKNSISKQEAVAATFSSYVSQNKTEVSPTTLYKDFKVIQN